MRCAIEIFFQAGPRSRSHGLNLLSLDNPLVLDLKLPSANSVSLGELIICFMENGQQGSRPKIQGHTAWETVNKEADRRFKVTLHTAFFFLIWRMGK